MKLLLTYQTNFKNVMFGYCYYLHTVMTRIQIFITSLFHLFRLFFSFKQRSFHYYSSGEKRTTFPKEVLESLKIMELHFDYLPK